jgi:Zn-dependent membrane protease YugP
MLQISALLVAAFLPAVLTALGLLWCRFDAARPSPRMPSRAGPWIEGWIRERGAIVAVEVVPADAPDAYWPNVGTLALSERTWAGDQPRDWAIAAHELGHAETVASHPALPWVLPGARVVAGLSWRLWIAALFAAALLSEPSVLGVALGALVTSILGTVVVCVDELVASRRARDILVEAGASRVAVRRAVQAMRAAAGAYVLGGVGQALLLLGWPLISAVAVVPPDAAVKAPSHLGIWLVLAMTPVVVVRAAQVLKQVVAPEPVPSELDLWALLARESQWEWACALGTLLMIAVLAPAMSGPVLAVAVAVALAAALGPIHAMLVAVVLLPGVLKRRFLGEPPAVRWPRRAQDDVPQAMIAMWSDPPWYLRAAWLLPLGYLPLVGLLVSRLLLAS